MLPPASPPAQIAPVSDGLILPPFPGELGIEIRYFLARVEPWLQAGWRILSRRPELYPEGSAICDETLTEAETALFARYGAVRLATGPKIIRPADRWPKYARAVLDRAKAQRLQREWRLLLRPYLASGADRPWTRWDRDLTTVSTPRAVHKIWKPGDALPPGYLPPAFATNSVQWAHPDHVGVQLRRLSWHDDGRNSDVSTVLVEAEAVAGHLALPLLVYGDPDGCVMPAGHCTTASLAPERLLPRELGYLRSCRVMMAPNSGWADLMCWLRVPVLIERAEPLWIFDMMAPFRPRLLWRRPDVPVEAQVDELLDGGTALPELGVGAVTEASLDEWIVGR
jgi:hypothetical protein